MEAWFIAASDGAWSMPNDAGWLALVILLLYAAIEVWSHVLPVDVADGSADPN